ncbi:hypothetical protein HZB60_02115 [candidate division KSB1 bacterium]|nr:hypothetical protein [candidate division KSB1 bacterium]
MLTRYFWLGLVLAVAALIFIGCPKNEDEKEPDPTPSITLTAPNGGETLSAGTTTTITWISTDVTHVTLQYSSDGGTTWNDIVIHQENANSYAWGVVSAVAPTCRIKVSDTNHPEVFDVSDGDFTILAAVVPDNGSGPVESDSSGVITTPAGARISVPVGAVPHLEDGNPATVVFSIERPNGITAAVPAGETQATQVYRFGPEGFVFAEPVEIAIPVDGNPDPGNVAIYRINPTTDSLEYYGGRYDAETHTIIAQTASLSTWFGTWAPARNTAAGCLQVTNLSNSWLRICVETYALTYPEFDNGLMPQYGLGGLWAPPGTIGWASEGKLFMPQGSYHLCIQHRDSFWPYNYSHTFTDVTINQPWHYFDHPNCSVSYTSGSTTLPDTGMCVCIPTPTIPVGTGAVQVTLTWFNEHPLDLDLWVTEPGGERCFYGHDVTSTGGTLDRDNLCGNYINGRPENIFWATNPPVGEYIVEVDWYSDCGNGLGAQAFQVRTVVQGNTRTETSSIDPNQTVEVLRYTVTGAGPQFLPPRTEPRVVENKVPKG